MAAFLAFCGVLYTLSFLPSSVLKSEMTSLNLSDLGQGSVGQGSEPVCDQEKNSDQGLTKVRAQW